MPPKFSFSFVLVNISHFDWAITPKKKQKVKLHAATQNRSFYFGKFPYKLLEINPHLYTSADMHLLPHPLSF